jgi:cobalt/nickel transport system permease protein
LPKRVYNPLIREKPEHKSTRITRAVFLKNYIKCITEYQITILFNYSMLLYFVNVTTYSGDSMHIPDAFIPIWQGAIYWIIALVFVALALRWARNEMSEEKIPLIAVLAAGIFALQSFNLPVSMGTSGHLVGGALAAIILGSPFAAVFILTLVLIVQAVLFGDGGITTLGANILNMGVIGGFVGFYTFRGLMAATKNVNIAAFIAAWLACVIPALACAIEMYFAGTFPLREGLIAMGLYHALIGIIEGFVTVVAIRLIVAARPDIVDFKIEVPAMKGVNA